MSLKTDKCTSTVRVEVKEKRYWMNHGMHDGCYYTIPKIEEHYKNVLYRYEIDKPYLEIGEIIYIPQLGVEVEVIRRNRDSDGYIVYDAKYNLKHILICESEEESYEKAKEKLDKEMFQYNHKDDWKLKLMGAFISLILLMIFFG